MNREVPDYDAFANGTAMSGVSNAENVFKMLSKLAQGGLSLVKVKV